MLVPKVTQHALPGSGSWFLDRLSPRKHPRMTDVVFPQYARSGVSVNGAYLCAHMDACVHVCVRTCVVRCQGAEAAHAPHVALVAGGRGVQRLCIRGVELDLVRCEL